MSAIAKFKSGTKSTLDSKPIDNGAIYVTTDTQELAVDIEDQRIFPNQIKTPIPIDKGGTNAANAGQAWSNLGGGSVGKINLNFSSDQFLRGDGTWAALSPYPVGAEIYSTESINPAELYGGVWTVDDKNHNFRGLYIYTRTE